MSSSDFRVNVDSEALSDPIVLGDREYNLSIVPTSSGSWDGASVIELKHALRTTDTPQASIDPHSTSGAAVSRTAPGAVITVKGPMVIWIDCTTHNGSDDVTLIADPPTKN